MPFLGCLELGQAKGQRPAWHAGGERAGRHKEGFLIVQVTFLHLPMCPWGPGMGLKVSGKAPG